MNPIEKAIARHGLQATYTRIDNPTIEIELKAARVNSFPSDYNKAVIQQQTDKWLVQASDLKSAGIERPYEGDRLTLHALGVIATVQTFGPRIIDGQVVAFDLEITGA